MARGEHEERMDAQDFAMAIVLKSAGTIKPRQQWNMSICVVRFPRGVILVYKYPKPVKLMEIPVVVPVFLDKPKLN